MILQSHIQEYKLNKNIAKQILKQKLYSHRTSFSELRKFKCFAKIRCISITSLEKILKNIFNITRYLKLLILYTESFI